MVALVWEARGPASRPSHLSRSLRSWVIHTRVPRDEWSQTSWTRSRRRTSAPPASNSSNSGNWFAQWERDVKTPIILDVDKCHRMNTNIWQKGNLEEAGLVHSAKNQNQKPMTLTECPAMYAVSMFKMAQNMSSVENAKNSAILHVRILIQWVLGEDQLRKETLAATSLLNSVGSACTLHFQPPTPIISPVVCGVAVT